MQDAAAIRAFARTSRLCWGLTLILGAGVAAGLAATPVRVLSGGPPVDVAVFAGFGLLGAFYTYIRPDLRIAAFCDALALGYLFTTVGTVYTYLATHLGAPVPYWDAAMLAADRALGLDWRACLAWMNAHPGLARVLDGCYGTIVPQLVAVIACLAATGRQPRLQVFLLAAQIAMLACGGAPMLMPALGAYAQLGIEPALHHPDIPLRVMSSHVPAVELLRGLAPVIDLGAMQGIITFPSFHLCMAVLFAWGFWGVPALRWPALALNGAMAAATPLSGSHYFVDLIAGGALAMAAIALAGAIRARIERGAGAPPLSAGEACREAPAAP